MIDVRHVDAGYGAVDKYIRVIWGYCIWKSIRLAQCSACRMVQDSTVQFASDACQGLGFHAAGARNG